MGKIVVKRQKAQNPLKEIAGQSSKLDQCLTCGTCAGGCPVADWEGMDPRKLIRMIHYDLDQEVIKSNWIWQCTNCQRCTWACPMGINFGAIITTARSLVPREE
ncbi:MAG: 4Fe-4S dicluster domain-containing protein, partial [bacterium]